MDFMFFVRRSSKPHKSMIISFFAKHLNGDSSFVKKTKRIVTIVPWPTYYALPNPQENAQMILIKVQVCSNNDNL